MSRDARNLTDLRMPRGHGGPMTPEQAQALSVVRQSVPYFSRCLLTAAKDGGNLLTFPAQKLRAFGYGLADPMTAAMSPGAPARTAAFCDTNLEQKGITNNSEEYRIFGVGIHINPTSDGELVRQIFPECSVQLQFGTQQGQLLGKPFHLPGGGGWAGTSRQDISAANSTVSTATNGWAEYQNIALFPEGILWNKQSEPDCQIAVIIELCNAVTIQGVAGTPARSTIDFEVRLFGKGQRGRSANQ